MQFSGKTVLVVGASGVLGSLMAGALAARGATVLATCSSNHSAARIPDAVAAKLLLDLRDSQSIETLLAYLNQNVQLDGLVVASGRVGFGTATSTSEANSQALMQINHLGPARLISGLVANLLRASEPFVAAVTGVIAEKVFPGMAAYTASKSAFSSWLKALRIENRQLTVIEARPGHTETGLAQRALFGEAPMFAQGMPAEHVVEVLMSAIELRKTELASTDF
jgi:cyclic-di-GMP-binding biofilm dispersal mediator protein